jgi:hypothetical protein
VLNSACAGRQGHTAGTLQQEFTVVQEVGWNASPEAMPVYHLYDECQSLEKQKCNGCMETWLTSKAKPKLPVPMLLLLLLLLHLPTPHAHVTAGRALARPTARL